MNNKKQTTEYLRETGKLFTKEGRPYSELWIIRELLNGLNISFSEEELIHGKQENDPVDVSFREAHFQTKTLLVPGRRPHEEYKNKIKKLESHDYDDEEVQRTKLKFITCQEKFKKAQHYLEKISQDLSYPSDVRKSVDLVVYFNNSEGFYHPEKSTSEIPEYFEQLGWRSISAVFGANRSAVLTASQDAPTFLLDRLKDMSSLLKTNLI